MKKSKNTSLFRVIPLVLSKFDPVVIALIAYVSCGFLIIGKVYVFAMIIGLLPLAFLVFKKCENISPLLWIYLLVGLFAGAIVFTALANKKIVLPKTGAMSRYLVTKTKKYSFSRYSLVLKPEGGGQVGNLKAIVWYEGYPVIAEEGDIVEAECDLQALDGSEPWHKAWYSKSIVMTGECEKWQRTSWEEKSPIVNLRLRFKQKIVSVVEQNLKPPMSSLLLGMLIGDDAGMPNDFEETMRTVGLTHIIVISGYNITVIFDGFRKALGFLGRYFADLLSIAGLAGFVWVVGSDPPVLRALVMVIIQIGARAFGRSITPIRSLLLASFVLLLIFPRWIYSASFHLSFLATFAIFYSHLFTPTVLLSKLGKIGVFLKEYFFQTLSVLLFTTPYSAAMFGEISTIALLSNMLVLPATEIAMSFGFVGIVFGLLCRQASKVVMFITWASLGYMIIIPQLLSTSNSTVLVDSDRVGVFAIGIYATLSIAIIFMNCQRVNNELD